MSSAYDLLVDKLKRFSRRYYLLKLLTGLALLLSVVLAYLLVVYIVEFHLFTSSSIRFLFLGGLFVLLATGFYFFIVGPLLIVCGLRKLSKEFQAKLVTEQFPELRDYLVNLVELAESESGLLVSQSIEQKIGLLKPFSFKQYFNFSIICKELVVSIVVAFLVILSVIFYPGIINKVSYRLVHFNQQFVKPSPFNFYLINSSTVVRKGGNLDLQLICRGEKLPEQVFAVIGGNYFGMEKLDSVFEYRLEHVQNPFELYFTDMKYVSDRYKVEVVPEPVVLDFSIGVDVPGYTQLSDFEIKNNGSATVPFGSQISWSFNCMDTDSLMLVSEGNVFRTIRSGNNFVVEMTVTADFSYKIILSNKYLINKELITYDIKVVPDLFPDIQVTQLQDSLDLNRYYFKGIISDDYGFNDLVFQLKFGDRDSLFVVDINRNMLSQEFYYSIDFKTYKSLSEHFSYYFTVRDNDALYGFKPANSEVFSFLFPNRAQFAADDNQRYQSVEKELVETKRMAEDLQETINQFRYKSLSDKMTDWERQQMLKNIQQKRSDLENQLNEISNLNQNRVGENMAFGNDREALIQKQQQIQELLDGLMDDELRSLFEELNKLANEFDSEKLNNLMENFSFPMEDLSEQLDRNLEMLKRLKIEQDLERALNELNSLVDKEAQNLSEFLREADLNKLSDKESDNKVGIDSVRNTINKALEQNNELDRGMNLFPLDNEFNELKQNFDDLFQHIEKKNKTKSEQNLKKNQELLQNMAFSLKQMIEQSQAQQLSEDIMNLKQILKNLIQVSLRQEDILNLTDGLSSIDPMVNQVQKAQDLILVQTSQVKDSVFALAGRNPAISSKVNSEFLAIDYSGNEAVAAIKEGLFDSSLKAQQSVMTAYNELALLLNEALENLEEAQANAKPGDQQCEKPGGGGSGSMKQLKDAQQAIKDQMQRMLEEMKNGRTGQLGEQSGKALVQHEMMKKMIQDLMNDSDIGSSAKEQLRAVEQIIEQNRVDLIQKKLTDQLIVRQNQILDRLLKAEKSEFERELDDKRESKSAEQLFYSNPSKFFQHKSKDRTSEESIRYFNIQLRSYYDQKYRDYLNQLNQ
ncbi:MAG: hypothetical protein ACK5JD_15370 [Mangrovibacterium sp.]